jgi:hypothetical protein
MSNGIAKFQALNGLLDLLPRDIRRYEHNTSDVFAVVTVPKSFKFDKIMFIPITQVKKLSDDDGLGITPRQSKRCPKHHVVGMQTISMVGIAADCRLRAVEGTKKLMRPK